MDESAERQHGMMPRPPIRPAEQQTPVIEEDDKTEERKAGERRSTKLLLATAAGGATLAYVMGTGGEPGTAVLLAATVTAGVNNAENILDVMGTVAEGAAMAGTDATKAIVGGAVEGTKAVVGGVVEGGKSVAGGVVRGTKEVGGGALVMTSELTKHGRENVRKLNQKRRELAEQSQAAYMIEVFGKFESTNSANEDERLTTAALMTICEKQAERHGISPEQVKAVIRDREYRLRKEREQGEDKVSMFLKLRRLMSVKGLTSAIGGAVDKTDELVYNRGFSYSKNRVDTRIAQTQEKIDENRRAYSEMRVNPPSGYGEKKVVTLGDIDAETQKRAGQIEDMLLTQEVVTDYILDIVDSHDEETVAKLNSAVEEWKTRIAQQESAAREEKKSQKREKAVGQVGGQKRDGTTEHRAVEKTDENQKSPQEIQEEKDFIRDRARQQVPKEQYQSGGPGTLNNFLFEVYAERNGAKMRALREQISKDPDAAWKVITAALADAPADRREAVEAEMNAYLAQKKEPAK